MFCVSNGDLRCSLGGALWASLCSSLGGALLVSLRESLTESLRDIYKYVEYV